MEERLNIIRALLTVSLTTWTAIACGDLGPAPEERAAISGAPPTAVISGTVFVDSVPAPAWRIELIGWLDAAQTASTPLGTRTTGTDGTFTFSIQPEAHHCGRMAAEAVPTSSGGPSPLAISPESGLHFPIGCGTTDGLDFHFSNTP